MLHSCSHTYDFTASLNASNRYIFATIIHFLSSTSKYSTLKRHLKIFSMSQVKSEISVDYNNKSICARESEIEFFYKKNLQVLQNGIFYSLETAENYYLIHLFINATQICTLVRNDRENINQFTKYL